MGGRGGSVWRTGGQAVRSSARRVLTAFTALSAATAYLAATPANAQATSAPARSDLTRALDRRLDSSPFNRVLWGVAVVDETGHLLYNRNADRLFVPASGLKLVVSSVAAALLPPTWTVRTSLYATGPLAGGVLQGDLILYGRGDPTFSHRCYGLDTLRAGACDVDPEAPLRHLADTLRAHGVRTIAGNLVGDGSWFEPLLVHPAWDSYDLNWWYAAPVSGLGVNDNSVDIEWAPGAVVGGPSRIAYGPPWSGITLGNRSVTVAGATGTTIDFFREPGTLHVYAQGQVAEAAAGRVEHFALPDPNLYTARALRSALADAGIAVLGCTRSTTDSTTYAAARGTPPLAEVVSRPLADWIFPILNSSQNWFAEMLVKQLGRQFGHSGSWDAGIAVERRFLIDSVGVDSTQFDLVDGSGLAESNLISPLAFTRLLRYMRHHPRYGTIAAALPRAGSRGSLRARFAGTPAAGHVVAKTGSIARVSTLSGYLELPDGHTITFSVMANHYALPDALVLAQIDAAVVDVARTLGGRAQAGRR